MVKILKKTREKIAEILGKRSGNLGGKIFAEMSGDFKKVKKNFVKSWEYFKKVLKKLRENFQERSGEISENFGKILWNFYKDLEKISGKVSSYSYLMRVINPAPIQIPKPRFRPQNNRSINC